MDGSYFLYLVVGGMSLFLLVLGALGIEDAIRCGHPEA